MTGSIASQMNDNYKCFPTDLLEQTRSAPTTAYACAAAIINNWERHRFTGDLYLWGHGGPGEPPQHRRQLVTD